jgi:hypothetical protein
VARLLADLDGDEFEVREKADAELEKLGEAVAGALLRVAKRPPSPEVAQRVKRLLAGLEQERSKRWHERLLRQRALGVLEWVDTAQARRLLRTLAAGAPGAPMTEEAKASLQRLAPRTSRKP